MKERVSLPVSRSSGKTDDAEFETFWRVYPRKEAKGAARRAYAKARKAADADTLTAGATRYASERAYEDPKFTKHPATWLNGECWAYEPKQPQVMRGEGSGGRSASRHAPKTSAEQAADLINEQRGHPYE